MENEQLAEILEYWSYWRIAIPPSTKRRVVGKADSEAILRQYFNDIIEKDIVTRLGITNSRALKQLVKMLFESTGSECSFRKLAGSTGVSADTVAIYAGHCEDARGIWPIQVSIEGPKDRHKRALEEFYEKFPNAMPETFCDPENFESALEQFGA
jgi:predicted AAA+ superfamily ATPase